MTRRPLGPLVAITCLALAGCSGGGAEPSSSVTATSSATAGAASTPGTPTGATASSGSVTAAASTPRALYRRGDTGADLWLTDHGSDRRAKRIRERIAARPIAAWFTSPDATATAREVDRYVGDAAAAKALPVLVLYAIPNRDCGGASAGGTRTASGYRAWIAKVAAALERRPAIIVLEPDSLALQTCLSASGKKARNALVAGAAKALRRADPAARVYLDAGHSAWNSPAETARRLKAAGLSSASGFFTNVSNYRRTSDEVAFGAKVRAALGSAASGKDQVIDTSRNGNGPKGSQWCDPTGRAVGTAPKLAPQAHVAAYLWVKPPGEADGCAAGAGTFVPDLAYALATG